MEWKAEIFNAILGATKDVGTTYFKFISLSLINVSHSRPLTEKKKFEEYTSLSFRDFLQTDEQKVKRVLKEIKVRHDLSLRTEHNLPPPCFNAIGQLLGERVSFAQTSPQPHIIL